MGVVWGKNGNGCKLQNIGRGGLVTCVYEDPTYKSYKGSLLVDLSTRIVLFSLFSIRRLGNAKKSYY